MFLDLDPRVEALHRVVGLDRDGALGDDGAMIDLLLDDMDRYACDLDTVFQSLLNGVGSRKGREKRWVDIEDAIGKTIDKRRREDSHEPRKHHTLRPSLLDHVCNGRREPITVREVAPPDNSGLDTGADGPGKCAGFGLIGDNDPYVRSDIRGIDKSLEICTRTRCEYCDVDLALRDAGAARSVERVTFVPVGSSSYTMRHPS